MKPSNLILWGLLVVLLILNLIVLYALNLARLTAVETLNKVETTLDNLANEVIVYEVEVNQAVPIKADVPFNQTVEVPLNTIIPIDQVLTVPLQTPAGEVVLDVPVKADFPIDIVVPVDFNQTINVDSVVRLDTTLPVEIDIAQTPLAGYLDQAKLDMAKLRNRLTLAKTAVVDEAAVVAASVAGTGGSATPISAGDSQSQSIVTDTSPGTAPTSETTHKSDTPAASQPAPYDSASLSRGTAAKNDLSSCEHAYWPLRPDTTWIYNSPDTSYSYQIDRVSSNQVELSTQYEGQDIQFGLVCHPEGLGGAFLGDMRRITEFGDLNFGNARGMFLPPPEVMEEIGSKWTQEFEIKGTVPASRRDGLVTGRISRGRAVATYTPISFETVETPLGPREALRIEQELDFELNIEFDLDGQIIPATQVVDLSNVYWFVRGMGLVKVHWQGGDIQHSFEFDRTPTKQGAPVPALAEEQAVVICVSPEGQTPECMQVAGASELNLTVPPQSELEVQGIAFPRVSSDEDPSTDQPAEESDADQPGEEPSGGVNGSSALLAYAEAVEYLGRQLYDAAQGFWEAALKFRSGELTFDEFRDEFLAFSPKVKSLIDEINRLSPPPEADGVHQELSAGLAKCDQAVGLMDDWFDTPDSGIEETATLLVTECLEDVTAAVDELAELTGIDFSIQP
jgi:hypothetical protein